MTDREREPVVVPGARDVRATLDHAPQPTEDGQVDRTTGSTDSDEQEPTDGDSDEQEPTDGDVEGVRAGRACVVACPPHPQLGGERGDRRLTATSDALAEQGIDCLRFDYGEWDDGYGEREDARNALRWATERYDRVGIYGYSFGGAIAILAAASVDVTVHAAAVLAPASELADDLDAAGAVPDLACPLHVGYSERDDTADSIPVVDAAERCQQSVVAYSSDHHFVGQHEKVGRDAAEFLATHLVD